MYGQQRLSPLAQSFPCLVLESVHFRAESPKCLWYQHTPHCDGEHEWDQVLLLLLCHPVAFKPESCLLKLSTSALSSRYSVACGVATIAMNGEITSIHNAIRYLSQLFYITLYGCRCQNDPDITQESLTEKSSKEKWVHGLSLLTE